MLKQRLRNFLNSAVINPNQKKDQLLKLIVDEGSVTQYEFKVMELVQEASRLRIRIESTNNKIMRETLLELYLEKLRLAATYVSLAAEKTELGVRPIKIVKENSTIEEVFPTRVQ